MANIQDLKTQNAVDDIVGDVNKLGKQFNSNSSSVNTDDNTDVNTDVNTDDNIDNINWVNYDAQSQQLFGEPIDREVFESLKVENNLVDDQDVFDLYAENKNLGLV